MTSSAQELVNRPLTRLAEAPVDSMFLQRWSARAFLPLPVSPEVVRSLFEAARWAPSAFNLQPWVFVYANDPESLERARPILMDGNRRWADRAPLLIFVFARRTHPETGATLRTASFDTGAAWLSLALQAERLGLKAHAMAGIHHDSAHEILQVPRDAFESLAAIAVGYPGPASDLPADLHAKEAPNSRKSQREFAFRGTYSASGPEEGQDVRLAGAVAGASGSVEVREAPGQRSISSPPP
jgi:nitroreductase